MVLHIYLLYYSPDSQGVPNIAPNFIPYMTSMLRMTTSITLILCHALSRNYIYIYQMVLPILEVGLEIVLHYNQQPQLCATQKGH